jgi:hypothetical protein
VKIFSCDVLPCPVNNSFSVLLGQDLVSIISRSGRSFYTFLFLAE